MGGSEDPPLLDRNPRWATAAFAASVVVAAACRLIWRRGQWFYQDEWAALADHDLSVSSLLDPHAEHWFTLPVLAYQVLYRTVGLDEYLPYFAMALGAHLAAAVTVWLVCRRVAPAWLAAGAGAAFVLTTSLMTVVSWYFLLTIALGLVQVLIADRDGPLDRRDALGLACGLAALMTTGLGVVMVAAAGAAALVRRGWSAAALHAVPLGAIYVGWTVTHGSGDEVADRARPSPGQLVEFVGRAADNAFSILGSGRPLGVVLAVVATIGVVASATEVVRGWRQGEVGSRALPAVLGLAALVFVLLTAMGRAVMFGGDFATRPRYALVVMALVLPAIASGAAEIVRRIHWAAVPAVALVLAGVPTAFGPPPIEVQPGVDRDALLAWGAPDGAVAALPAPFRPFSGQTGANTITLGWLREARARGRLGGEPSAEAVAAVREEVLVVYFDPWRPVGDSCHEVDAPEEIVLGAGEAIGVRGVVYYAARGPDGTARPLRGRDVDALEALVAVEGPTTVVVGPSPRGGPIELCR